MRLTLVCSRPAVSTSTTSTPRGRGGVDRVEHHCTGVAAVLAAHDLAAEAVGPQSRAGRPPRRGRCRRRRGARGARRPARAWPASATVVVLPTPLTPTSIQTVGPLAARCRVRSEPPSAVERLGELVAQEVGQCGGVGAWPLARACTPSTIASVVVMPDVGEQQRLLELVPRVVVDLAAPAERADEAGERGPGLAEPVAEAGRLERPRPSSTASTGRPSAASSSAVDDDLGRPRRVGACRPGVAARLAAAGRRRRGTLLEAGAAVTAAR